MSRRRRSPPIPGLLPTLAGLVTLGIALLARWTRRLVGRDPAYHARLPIRAPTDDTRIDADGAARSIQAAAIDTPAGLLSWTPVTLERVARTYWVFLSTWSLGLVRVHYTRTERSVCLLLGAIRLLTFGAPEYELDDERGIVRWRIKGGLLVAARGHDGDGYLEIELRRMPSPSPDVDRLWVEVEVASFYPALSGRLGSWIYANTQSRIHVLLVHAFLHRLTRRQLTHSRVGRFRDGDTLPPADAAAGTPHRERSEPEQADGAR